MDKKAQIRQLIENMPQVYEAGQNSLKQDVSNALKGNPSGEVVALKDVSPIEHNLKVEISGVDNPEAVKITAQGGNLFDVYSITETNGFEIAGEIFKGYRVEDVLYNPLGSYWSGNRYEGFALKLPKGKYTVSCDAYTNLSNTGSVSCFLYPTNGSNKLEPKGSVFQSCPVGKLTHLKWAFDLANDGEFYLGLQGGGNDANYRFLDLSFRNIQVEIGEESKFAPYVKPIEYTYGEEIKSIYPSTTLMTDTAGAVLTVEYNIDLNEAFAKLYQAIISIGGNV